MGGDTLATVAPYLLAVVFVLIPLILAPRDMWDGSIIEHAMDTGNLSGLRVWFFTGNWELQYWLIFAERAVSQALGVGFRAVNLTVIALALGLIIHETRLIALERMKLSAMWATVAASLVAVFPAWWALLSSVLTVHLLCLGIGLLGCRLLWAEDRIRQTLGLVIIFLSFQLSSMLVLLPVLSWTFDVLRGGETVPSRRWIPSLRSGLILLAAVVHFSIRKVFFPASGLYEGYNGVVVPLSQDAVLRLVADTARFASFLIIPAIGVLVALVVGGLIGVRRQPPRPRDDHSGVVALLALLLVAASVFPYLAVGKPASLTQLTSTTIRQAFALAPSLALFSVASVSLVGCRLRLLKGQGDLHLKIAAVVLIAVQLGLLVFGLGARLNILYFEQDLQAVLALQEAPPAGRLQIVGEGNPAAGVADYEANRLAFQAWGDTLWWTRMGTEFNPAFEIPRELVEDEANQVKYIFTPSSIECSSTISIEAVGYRGTLSGIGRILSLPQDRSIHISGVASECP